MRRFALSITAVVLGCAAGVVNAQLSAPPMVSALPDVSSISAANAAGVLHYCASHHLVSSTAADVLVRSPTERAALRTSPEFAAGNAGHIITQGKSFAIARVSAHLQSQSCDLVLRQAQRMK